MHIAQKKAAKKFLKKVGSNLCEIRIARKKAPETVAKAMKISTVLLEKIEKGEYDMDIILFLDFCQYYKISVGDVLPDKTSDNK
jgi:DNA-binding XRE family transcriptional regulator